MFIRPGRRLGGVDQSRRGRQDTPPSAVQFVACRTSYHAALYGATVLREMGIPAEAYLASEYTLSPPPLSLGTLVVGITQSGETVDTLAALRDAKSRGVNTLALTNTVNSTAAHECDHAVYIRARSEWQRPRPSSRSWSAVICWPRSWSTERATSTHRSSHYTTYPTTCSRSSIPHGPGGRRGVRRQRRLLLHRPQDERCGRPRRHAQMQ